MNTWLNHFCVGSVLKASKCLASAMLATLLCNSHQAFALEINQANEAELDSLKGMGPSLSAKVLKARTDGPFKNWADLMQRVAGVGRAKAQQFSDQGLTVDGQTLKPEVKRL